MVARLVLALLLLLSSVAAAFATDRMPTGSPVYDECGGSTTNLPVNCLVSKEQAVAAALALVPVQPMLQEFARRGYVAVPSAHTYLLHCGEHADGSPAGVMVVLGFMATDFTGLRSDSTIVVPQIVVTTYVDPETGGPSTQVLGGAFAVDDHIYPADSLYPQHSAVMVGVGTAAGCPTCRFTTNGEPINWLGVGVSAASLAVYSYGKWQVDAWSRYGKCSLDTAGRCLRDNMTTALITLMIARTTENPQLAGTAGAITVAGLLSCYVTGVWDCWPAWTGAGATH